MNYLDMEKLEYYISHASIRQISKIWMNATDFINLWGMYSLEGFFSAINTYIPEINEFTNIEAIKSRAFKTKEDKLHNKWDDIYGYLPELTVIRDAFQKAFVAMPSGVEKTEAWLYPCALNAISDADLEALIYFRSQGESFVSSETISQSWLESICNGIAKGRYLFGFSKEVVQRANDKKLSLAQLAEIFEEKKSFPYFLLARDEEEDFITATFFRAVEWLQLFEFEPWINAYASDISTIYQDGIDEAYTLYTLFYLCRSDLILRKVSKLGLEALLLGLCIGHIEPSKPWKRYWSEREQIVNYLPAASIISFAWKRINPTNINSNILEQSLSLLIQSQLHSGAWPLTSEHLDGDILSTSLAMLALAINRPEGYQRYLNKARDWLLGQQNELGCWHIQGAPAVMINILCLESIKLAEGKKQITYRIDSQVSMTVPEPVATGVVVNQKSDEVTFELSKNIFLRYDDIKYGIITALPKEYAAIKALIPEGEEIVTGKLGNKKPYVGVITNQSGRKCPVAIMMSGMGNNQAAARATELVSIFPSIKSIIMCGIAGGTPNPTHLEEHVRLGDIVVSSKQGVVQYDYVKDTWNEVKEKCMRVPPDANLLYAVDVLESQRLLGASPWESYIDYIIKKYPHFSRPAESEDVFYDVNDILVPHPIDISRNSYPKIFIGPIASANTLLKNPERRDMLRHKYDIKAVEMEASGIADATWNMSIGYLAVRGICDYCDKHKNDVWQLYAAIVAAAYTRALLETVI